MLPGQLGFVITLWTLPLRPRHSRRTPLLSPSLSLSESPRPALFEADKQFPFSEPLHMSELLLTLSLTADSHRLLADCIFRLLPFMRTQATFRRHLLSTINANFEETGLATGSAPDVGACLFILDYFTCILCFQMSPLWES